MFSNCFGGGSRLRFWNDFGMIWALILPQVGHPKRTTKSQMGARWPRKGFPKRPKIELFSDSDEKMEILTKQTYFLCFSYICQPRNRRFSCKLDVSKCGPRRGPPKMLTHRFQKLAIRAPGETSAGKGSRPSPQRDSKRAPKGIQNRRFQRSRRTGDRP